MLHTPKPEGLFRDIMIYVTQKQASFWSRIIVVE